MSGALAVQVQKIEGEEDELIRVAFNRTQAAIWAMANGYAAGGANGRLLNPDSARNAAAITEAAIRSVATNRGPFSEYT